jgi:hypothetical protein
MKRLLFAFVLTLGFVASTHAQTPYADYAITVTDGTGHQELRFGLDPTATDGIDALDQAAPPPGPLGTFDARFVGTDVGISTMDQGVFKDYRQGGPTTKGTRLHEISYQVGSGTSITINWNLPSGVTGRLQDIITGSLIDVSMSGSGNYTVTNPGPFSHLKMTITYSLQITTSSPLPTANVGAPYSTTLAAQFGPTPYTWSITSGSLPDGLGISTSGVISGTPTSTGSASVSVKASDASSTNAPKDFTVSVEGPLPIELSGFKGSVAVSTGAKLEWTTLSEINDYGFYVQRRGDNDAAFADLKESFVPGHGTSSVVQHYSFCDVNPLNGIVWYRLKQQDLDGSIHFTEAIMMDVTYMVAPKEFALMNNYPNPFNPATTIQFSVAVSGRVTLRVYNSIGEEVATLFDGNAEPGQYHRVTLDGKNLSSGMYVYRLQSANNLSTRRAMLIK